MKKGLVLEGGAMRGLFSAGIMDYLMEKGVKFDAMMTVSAGACFGCNYKSGQIGRVLRYNSKYCRDKRFCSMYSLMTTGDLFGADFCYRLIPEELDPFDYGRYRENPTDFYAVCTDVRTGKAVYPLLKTCDREEVKWIQASASMPLVSKPVKIGEGLYLDGGIADPIPLAHFEEMGYRHKNLVILTRPRGYEKKKSAALPAMKAIFRKYPALYDAMARRHEVYNESVELVLKREKEGSVLLLCPDEALPIERTEHDPAVIRRTWDLGYRLAGREFGKIADFLKE